MAQEKIKIKIGIVSDLKYQGDLNIKTILFKIKQHYDKLDTLVEIIGAGRKNNDVDRTIQKYSLDFGFDYSEYTTDGNTLYSINKKKITSYLRNIYFVAKVDFAIILSPNSAEVDSNTKSIIKLLTKQRKQYIFK